MHDADYEEFLKETKEAAGNYFTRKSGEKAQHSDGVVRDTDKGKTKYTLMFPEGVPMKDQLIVRIAELYTRGGEAYGDRNWEASSSEDTLIHHTDALWRHFINFFFDVQDKEDHAAAVVWNVNAVDLTRRNIRIGKLKELIKEPDAEPTALSSTDLGDGVTMEIDPGEWTGQGVPEWAKHSAKCCSAPAYSSLPFSFNDGCGKGCIPSTPLHGQLKSYTFPYVGPDTASTGRYLAKEIFAKSYNEAKRAFSALGLPNHFMPPASKIPGWAIPAVDLEWSQGDVLEECTIAGHSNGLCWVYDARSDTWTYKDRVDEKPAPESARSLKRLVAEFGPLTCTKGSHTGRIVGGA